MKILRSTWVTVVALVVSALLGALAGPVPSAAVTAREVVDQVQARLNEHRTLSARFEKHFYWAALDKRSTSQGRVYLERPSRFRVEIADGDVVVADGKAIWSYSPGNNQVVVSPYQGEIRTPWEMLLDYTEGLAPVAVEEAELGRRACYLVTLQPQASGSVVTGMKVWVERATWLVQQVEQTEANDNVTTYVLLDQKTNTRLRDDLFRFRPPAGAEIVDRRGTGSGDR